MQTEFDPAYRHMGCAYRDPCGSQFDTHLILFAHQVTERLAFDTAHPSHSSSFHWEQLCKDCDPMRNHHSWDLTHWLLSNATQLKSACGQLVAKHAGSHSGSHAVRSTPSIRSQSRRFTTFPRMNLLGPLTPSHGARTEHLLTSNNPHHGSICYCWFDVKGSLKTTFVRRNIGVKFINSINLYAFSHLLVHPVEEDAQLVAQAIWTTG